jgi:hypothetical protein
MGGALCDLAREAAAIRLRLWSAHVSPPSPQRAPGATRDQIAERIGGIFKKRQVWALPLQSLETRIMRPAAALRAPLSRLSPGAGRQGEIADFLLAAGRINLNGLCGVACVLGAASAAPRHWQLRTIRRKDRRKDHHRRSRSRRAGRRRGGSSNQKWPHRSHHNPSLYRGHIPSLGHIHPIRRKSPGASQRAASPSPGASQYRVHSQFRGRQRRGPRLPAPHI